MTDIQSRLADSTENAQCGVVLPAVRVQRPQQSFFSNSYTGSTLLLGDAVRVTMQVYDAQGIQQQPQQQPKQ